MRNTKSKIIKLIIFSLIPVMLIVLVGEIATRVKYYLSTKEISFLLTPVYSRFKKTGIRQNTHYSKLYKTHSVSRNCEKMNWEKVITYTINKEGMRGEDFEPIKPSGVFRIVMLGGSGLYGVTSSDENTIPVFLEAFLNASGTGPQGRFEIINAGQCGMSLMGYAKNNFFYNRISKIISYSPDMVIFYEAINDAETKSYVMMEANDRIAKLDALGWLHSLLYYRSMLYTYLAEKNIFNAVRKKIGQLDRFSEAYISEVGGMIQKFKDSGITVVFVKQAYDFPLQYNGIEYTDNEGVKNAMGILSGSARRQLDEYWGLKQRFILNLQEKLAAKYAVSIIDPLPEMEQMQALAKDLFCDKVHLTDKGNRQLARIISRGIYRIWEKKNEK